MRGKDPSPFSRRLASWMVDWNACLSPKELALVGLLHLLLALILFSLSLYRGDYINGGGGDITIFLSDYYVLAENLKNGSLPFWNPYYHAGVPFLAINPGPRILYPPTAIYYLFPLRHAWNIYIILHLVLAGTFMYAFCSGLSFNRWGRLYASIAYALSQHALEYIRGGAVDALVTYAWLPLGFYCIDRVVRRPGRMCPVLLGSLVVATLTLGGNYQKLIYALIGIALYSTFRLILSRREKASATAFRSLLVSVAAVIAIGIGLAAVQLLPVWAFTRHSVRSLPLGPEMFFEKSMHPLGIAGALSPYLLGEPTLWIYAGMLTLFMIVTAYTEWRMPRLLTFFGLLTLFSLLISFGKYLPGSALLYYLPYYDRFRIPSKILVLASLSAAVTSGLGFGIFCAKDTADGKLRRSVLCFGAVVTALLLLMALLAAERARAFLLVPAYFHAGARNFGLPLLMLALTGGIIYWKFRCTRGIARPLLLPAMALLVAAADLIGLQFEFVNRPSPNLRGFLAEGPIVRRLRGDRGLFRVATFGGDLEGRLETILDRGMVFGISDINGDGRLPLLRYMEYTNFTNGDDIQALAKPAGLNGIMVVKNPDSKLIDLLNVKYLIVDGGEGKAEIRENPNYYPRATATFAYRVMPGRSKEERKRILGLLASSDYDPREFIVLEERPKEGYVEEGRAGAPREAESRIRVKKYTPNEVVLEVELSRPGFLLLNDIYYPAWRGEVDGEAASVYRANYLFRALPLREGSHEVVFRFRDPWFAAGAAISLSLLLALGAALAVGSVRRLSARRTAVPKRYGTPRARGRRAEGRG